MITVNGDWFALETANTGYYLGVRGGLVENLHYGARVRVENSVPLREKTDIGYGGDVVYRAESAPLSLEHLCLELSPLQKGDYRAQSLSLVMPGGARTADFSFVCARRLEGSVPPEGMPAARGGAETLALDFSTPEGVAVTLFYTVYPDCDVITRRLCIKNGADAPVTLEKALSYQLDLPGCDYVLSTFPGAWARERHEACVPLTPGAHVFGSTTGASSAFCNPFFMLCAPDATEFNGDAYGFNLVYSGSHMGCVEVSPWGKTRVAAGIQPEGFAWTLAPGERFETPEAVLTFSRAGKNGMSANLHAFVQEHIVRGKWAKKDRPVLLNNWEATHCDFDEARLKQLFDGARQTGAELFLLDDGWFGNGPYSRDDDKHGLGDWEPSTKKLPRGLSYIAREALKRKVGFGIWLEPEMVNPQSELYQKHPDWIITQPKREPILGRHQEILDLTRPEVQAYEWDIIDRTLRPNPDITYVKWDCNRYITQPGSSYLQSADQSHLWIDYNWALYRLMDRFAKGFPNVMAMLCAGGSGRVDYGAMPYFHSFWPSDNTDPLGRIKIQWGFSHFFPANTISAHVTRMGKRHLKMAIDVALSGAFGIDLALDKATAEERAQIADAVKLYKERIRPLVMRGELYRLVSPYESPLASLSYVSTDKKQAVVYLYQTKDGREARVKLGGLDAGKKYRIEEVSLSKGMASRFPANGKVLTGAELMTEGLENPLDAQFESAVLMIETL